MLSAAELRELVGIESSGACFVSLYMNVNPVTNPRGEYLIWFRNEARRVSESLEGDIRKRVRKDLAGIEAYLRERKRLFRKGLALISSAESSFWREYNLAVPLRGELIVDTLPYIKPLLDVAERHRRYAVLVVDKESARIFVIHLGEIAEYGEVHTPDVPGRHKKGGWYALSGTHYDRHIEYHVGLHLRDVLRKLDSFMKGEEMDMLLLGGPDEVVARTRGLLPAKVAEKVIGSFSAGMYESNDGILRRAEPLVLEYERRFEEQVVTELVNRALKGEKAVTGLAGVLKALHEGRVWRLVFERDLKADGVQCGRCGALAAKKRDACPYCGGEQVVVKYIVDFAAQQTVERGGAVEVVSPFGEFQRSGRIGAFLRF